MLVRVYRNLHKGCLSVQAKVNGRWKVIGHVPHIVLHDVTFKVSDPGRQRVLREKRKNVHAFVVGTAYSGDWTDTSPTGRRVSYNPYKGNTFYTTDDSLPISSAGRCIVGPDGIHVW